MTINEGTENLNSILYPLLCIDICDWILENSSKSHMKSGVFLHVFDDISIS